MSKPIPAAQLQAAHEWLDAHPGGTVTTSSPHWLAFCALARAGQVRMVPTGKNAATVSRRAANPPA